jgi:large subunit ribosomal protein L19
MTEISAKKQLPDFGPGDTVRVHYRIVEGDKSRVQPFEGIVISKRGTQVSKTFMVRRIGADNVAVERIFPLFSPNIEKIDVVRQGSVRRAKLYFMRDKLGKEAKRVKKQKEVL